jgi:cobalt-zinc-cadmium efflux system outer membrane protein
MTLSDAIDRTVASHPDLRIFASTEIARQAAVDVASQAPALSAGLDIENLGANGTLPGTKATETTVTLASVLERGGKRDARRAVALGELDALGLEREAKRLDLMAEVARRYLDVVHAQAEVQLSDADIVQRRRTVAESARRVQAGAAPESTRLTAEAAQARAELEHARAQRQVTAAFSRLALLWNERSPRVRPVVDELMMLPEVPEFSALVTLIERTPELQRFASEARLREARLQLARASRTPDITWRLGVRRLQDEHDWGAVAGVSIPLRTAQRAEPQARSAAAELDALAIERQSSELTLYATLAEAHGTYVSSRAEVQQFQTEVLPRLARAESAAERAYRAGAISYLEWAQVQNEIIEARERQLAAADEGQRALIEIQRLTNEPFVQDSR